MDLLYCIVKLENTLIANVTVFYVLEIVFSYFIEILKNQEISVPPIVGFLVDGIKFHEDLKNPFLSLNRMRAAMN